MFPTKPTAVASWQASRSNKTAEYWARTDPLGGLARYRWCWLFVLVTRHGGSQHMMGNILRERCLAAV